MCCLWTECRCAWSEAAAGDSPLSARRISVRHDYCHRRRPTVGAQCRPGCRQSGVQSSTEGHGPTARTCHCHAGSHVLGDEDNPAVCLHRWDSAGAERRVCCSDDNAGDAARTARTGTVLVCCWYYGSIVSVTSNWPGSCSQAVSDVLLGCVFVPSSITVAIMLTKKSAHRDANTARWL